MAPLLLFALSILLLFAASIKWTSQRKNISAAAALSRTPNDSPLLDQLDDFYRENLFKHDWMVLQAKYFAFLNRLQAQIAHLPQTEQDEFIMPLVIRNAEYIAIGKRDQNALKARLGMAI
jgi:hypothetical protein